MKRWIILGIVLSILLVGTMAIMVGFFFSDLSTVFDQTPTTGAVTEPFDPVPSTTYPATEPSTPPATEPSTLPETEPPTEVTTEETTEETTEAPTEPPTQPPTEPPPTTQPPTQPPTEPPATQPETEPEDPIISGLSASHGFVYDTATGEYLYTFGEQQQRIKMASITKLFSAYVALQHMDPEETITAGEEVTWIDKDSSRAWIYQGQTLTVTTCIQGMIIPSGNDAAYVLAVATGRVLLDNNEADARSAFDAFVAEMNAQAQALGLTGTHFANPDGIDDPEHYSTCTDLLAIAKLAMTNSTISRSAATAQITAHYTSGQSANWTNSNRLLHSSSPYYCPAAIGLKTGHTDEAGWCLISAFEQNSGTLIIGVFGSDTMDLRDQDTLILYEEFE